MTTLSQILARDKALAPLMEEERACVDVTVLLTELMRRKAVTRSELARRLNKSKAYVTQLLDGTTNMTIRTIAGVLFHLGHRLHVESVPMADDDYAAGVGLRMLRSEQPWQIDVREVWTVQSVDGSRRPGQPVARGVA